MKPFAVIRTGGKQYIVEEDSTITVDRINEEVGKSVVFTDVLLYAKDEDSVKIGTPIVPKITVKGTIEEQGKEAKIRVARFRSKSRSRKVRGFRAAVTKVHITGIEIK